jgi:large subunit ribosomal protein L19
MDAKIIEKMNLSKMKDKGSLVSFAIGDTVKISVKIKEGDKERIQAFTGTVIGRRGSGFTESFTVRRISHGVGVERVFPIHSPYVTKMEVVSSSQVRRAKLYFLRQKSGKKARLKERSRPQEVASE